MISFDVLKRISAKDQTTEMNIAREYLQNLFLSYFYQNEYTEHILFKGGTALRIIHQSPRYSEDLDFTALRIKADNVENAVKKTIDDIGREGLNVRMTESKFTSGGYLGIVESTIGEFETRIQIEVSMRSPGKAQEKEGNVVLITSQFMPPYTLSSLSDDAIVSEKICALLARKKPRDFFDLYFILRSRLSRKTVAEHKEKLILETRSIDNKEIGRELKVFLPRKHWNILGNFREQLIRELERA